MALNALVDAGLLNSGCMNTAYALKLQFPNQLSTSEDIDWEPGFGFAQTIMSLLTSSGLLISGAEMAWGSFTPAGNITSACTITHGMTAAPDLAILFAYGADVGQDAHAVLLKISFGDNLERNESGVVRKSASGAITMTTVANGEFIGMSLGSYAITVGASATCYLQGGKTYYWFAYRAPVSGGESHDA